MNGLLELAIEEVVDKIFNGEILLEDPTETTKLAIESINEYLK